VKFPGKDSREGIATPCPFACIVARTVFG